MRHVADEALERCEACGSRVKPDGPGLIWKVAVAGAWLACLIMCAATVASAIMMIIVAPIAVVIGMFLLSVTHGEAFRNARCPVCGAAMFPRKASEAESQAGDRAHE